MDNLTEKQVFALILSGQFDVEEFENWVENWVETARDLAFENGISYIESLCDAKELDD